MNNTKLIVSLLSACCMLGAQDNNVRMAAGDVPIFRSTVTAHTTKAINYRHRSGATKIDFRGTDLLPGSHGEAKVESKQGYIEIEVEYRNLKPASMNGAEYLTYVLWAVTPEGRTSNLGEILLNGTSAKLNVTTELQAFALIVTAEPYYAVSMPSDLIVMENVVRADTIGKIEEVDAKYELLQRGQYTRLVNPLSLKTDGKTPLELYEARNAVQIARSVGADRYATETFQKAEKSLTQAEAYQTRKAGSKPITMTSREAVQTAEDARAIAVKRQEEEYLAKERENAANQTARAENASAAAKAETARIANEAEAARLRAAAEKDRLTREKNAQISAALADADRAKAATDRANADAAAKAAAASAEAARLNSELDAAAKQRAQLEADKAALRSQLLTQFSLILQTRDTARGLIVNMDDVLFDTGKFTLRPLAREKLAKIAGIVSGHPGLKLDVEGHTDSVGSDDYNQKLSENRGSAVRDYLTGAGMAGTAVTTKGFGKTQPVASNDTPSGRQQNRRVELVISGEVIGTTIGNPITSK
ncbi:MAG: OmpA/MotB domain protein [Bryobacterales bacterium]|nr:OmpA/MotB domain protein [Bryobacterales bacterium]